MFALLKKLFFLLAGRRYYRLFLLMGLLILCPTLQRMGQTAAFVHQAKVVTAVVTDVRQKPFNSTLDALLSGNLSTAEDTAYIPTLRFTLPNGHTCTREPNYADNRDFAIGSSLNVLTYENDPTQVCPYRFKFLWGGECFRVLCALFCLLLGRLLHGPFLRRRPRPARREAPAAEHRAPQPAPQPKPRKKSPPATAEEVPEEPKPRRSRRKKEATPPPAEDGEPPKKTRRRRKKAEPEQPNLL